MTTALVTLQREPPLTRILAPGLLAPSRSDDAQRGCKTAREDGGREAGGAGADDRHVAGKRGAQSSCQSRASFWKSSTNPWIIDTTGWALDGLRESIVGRRSFVCVEPIFQIPDAQVRIFLSGDVRISERDWPHDVKRRRGRRRKKSGLSLMKDGVRPL